MKTACHCIVKNEENWLWYSLMSVLDFVDEIDLIDTGSTDKTLEIISTINSPKIKLTQAKDINVASFTDLRNLQLTRSQADWILILDGDEVWPQASMSASLQKAVEDSCDYLISSYVNCVGDVFHKQPSNAGKYKIKEYSGHVTLRWFRRNLPGIHYGNPYGSEGLFISDHHHVYDSPSRYTYISQPYFHLTHLTRSSISEHSSLLRTGKYKYELGLPLGGIDFPVSFYFPRPTIVPTAWSKRSLTYALNAAWQTPLKIIKRSLSHA